MSDALNRINEILDAVGVVHVEKIEHPPVYTCEEADAYTPDPTAGLKSILVTTRKGRWAVCVLLGKQRLDARKVKDVIGSKIQFAKAENAVELLGCEPGSIPPFGHKTTVAIFVDPEVRKMGCVYFNPGVNTQTYGLTMSDFEKILAHCSGKFIDISVTE